MDSEGVEDDMLINLVRNYPQLYNSRKTNYNLYKKNKIWEKIAKNLNKRPVDCKLKWRNIRDCYRKHQQRKKFSASFINPSKYDDEKYSFLYETVEFNNVNISDDSNSENVEISTEEIDHLAVSENISDDDESQMEFKPEINFCNVNFVNENDMKPSSSNTIISHVINEKKSIEQKHPIQMAEEKIADTTTHSFFSCMADIVSKFPPESIAEIRMKVCTIVTETELMLLKSHRIPH